jgi:ferrous iron transport protein A
VDLLRLNELKAGEEATLQGFEAGHGLISRLAALGFTPGARVSMVQNFGHGPLIVKVRDTHIALGRGEAMKVRVSR